MSDNEHRKWFNTHCCSSHHLNRPVYECQQTSHSSSNESPSKVVPMYDLLRVEKEAMVNLLCRQSITCLENRLKSKIEAKERKSGIVSNTEVQGRHSGNVRSTDNESFLCQRQTPQKGSLCLRRAKKKLFHPDVEPDDEEEDAVCNCCTCKQVDHNVKGKVFNEPKNKAIPSCGRKEQSFSSHVNFTSKESQTKGYRKRKLDENNDFARADKKLKLDLLDISSFEPRDCSTPYVNKSQGNLPLSFRPPKIKFPLLETPCPPPIANIQEDLKVTTPRIITIEDFSQADEGDAVSYLPSNKHCMEGTDENITRINDGSSEVESKLNRTFTVSQNKDSSSPMFTSSSGTPFEIPVIDSLPNSPIASPSSQKVPSPQPSTSQWMPLKRSDGASSASSNLTFSRRMTRSAAKSDLKNSTCLNEASPSKSFAIPAESSEKQSMLPMATSSLGAHEKEEVELLDWCVIQRGPSFLLSGYIYDPINRKYVKIETGTIAIRHRASLIETSDGKLYRLMNKFVKSRSNISDASQYFQNGFPENWEEVLGALVDKKIEVPEKRPKHVTSIKEVKKQKRSLNSSFFDLPAGKGTPETPLRREDLRQTRKSGRYVVPPLAYWKNQRIMIDPTTNETLIIDGGRNFLDINVVHFVG